MSEKARHRTRKEIIVSVRLPRGLLNELRDLQSINHFMDLSDEIRFILRQKFFSNTTQTEDLKKEQMIKDLENLLFTIRTNQFDKASQISNEISNKFTDKKETIVLDKKIKRND